MTSNNKVVQVVYNSINDTLNHDGVEHAGYLAFLGLLSFFPFLVLLVALTGAFGQSQLGNEFVNTILSEIPEQFIAALRPRIEEIVSGPPPSLKTIAILAMIWTASSAVEGARTILNRAYRVATPPAYIWRRMMSIFEFFLIMILVTLALFTLIIVPSFLETAHGSIDMNELIAPYWVYIRYGASVLIVFLSVAASYYVLPNIKQKWSHVWPGTLLVMVLWAAAVVLLSIYINNFRQVNLVYGSLEGIIIALLFFYVLGLIYILGAEFNYHVEKARGNKVVEKEKVKTKYDRNINVKPSSFVSARKNIKRSAKKKR